MAGEMKKIILGAASYGDEKLEIVFEGDRAFIMNLDLLEALEDAGEIDAPIVEMNGQKVQLINLCG